MRKVIRKFMACVLAVMMLLSISALAVSSEAVDAAENLHELGLLAGAGVNDDGSINYNYDGHLTRMEAIVMLIRLSGEEETALSETPVHPFSDVPAWADPYVGRAYKIGLSVGISDTEFGSTNEISAPEYMTLMLRMLGYSSSSDFQWDKSIDFAAKLGLVYASDAFDGAFLRSQAFVYANRALDFDYVGAGFTLGELISAAFEHHTTISALLESGILQDFEPDRDLPDWLDEEPTVPQEPEKVDAEEPTDTDSRSHEGSTDPMDYILSDPDSYDGVVVYITDTGLKYHRDGCRFLAESSYPIALEDAVMLGYTECGVCY